MEEGGLTQLEFVLVLFDLDQTVQLELPLMHLDRYYWWTFGSSTSSRLGTCRRQNSGPLSIQLEQCAQG